MSNETDVDNIEINLPDGSTKKKFDTQNFNASFERAKEARKKKEAIQMQIKLDELNKPPPLKMVHEYSIGEIVIGIKDTWFELLDDMLQYEISLELFTKKNRLYFIGMTILIIVGFLFIFNLLFGEEKKKTPDEKMITVNHVHKIIGDLSGLIK